MRDRTQKRRKLVFNKHTLAALTLEQVNGGLPPQTTIVTKCVCSKCIQGCITYSAGYCP
jgi:hypothetical protein